MDHIAIRVWAELQIHAGSSLDAPEIQLSLLRDHLNIDDTMFFSAVRSLANAGAVEFLNDHEMNDLANRKRIPGEVVAIDHPVKSESTFLRIISPRHLRVAFKAKLALLRRKIMELEKAKSNGQGVIGAGWSIQADGALTPGEWDAIKVANEEYLLVAAFLEQIPAEKEREAYRREPIPREVRDAVWRRDQGRCVQCESREYLEFDHIIPVAKGGANTVRNLQLLCEGCNRKKSDSI